MFPSTHPTLSMPPQLDQKFPPAAGSSSSATQRPLPEALLRDWKQMGDAWQTSACPIVIRLEALTDEGRAESRCAGQDRLGQGRV